MVKIPSTNYIPNPALEKLLGATLEMKIMLHDRADEVVKAAKDIAPVSSGDYRDGLDAESGLDKGGMVGRVNANDWKSGFIEFGTSTTPTFAVLRRAIDQVGLKFKRSGD